MNLHHLSMAILKREATRSELPGYINFVGIGGTNRQSRASWAVMTLPYMEQQVLWDSWSVGKPRYTSIETFLCPSDPPTDRAEPSLSYCANSGYVSNADTIENFANGVFFDHTRTKEVAIGPDDERDVANARKEMMSVAYLQAKGAGTARTLMLSENLNALHWGYTLDKDREETKDRSYHFGFCWEQPSEIAKAEADETTKRYRRINSRYREEEISSFAEMTPDDGFPSSNHPEIVNVAFASGSVQAMNQDIDPLVYAQLMTSNHKLSDLRDVDGKAEKELEQPDEGDW